MSQPIVPPFHSPPRRGVRRRYLLLLAGLLAGGVGIGLRYAGVLAAAMPGCTARNGDMEDLFVNGVAFGWDNNSWGDAEVKFSRESADPHAGRSAQRIRLERVTQGAAQIRQLGISVRAGQAYTLSVWLRGTVEKPVFVGIRQNEAPYKRYLVQYFRVSPQWRRFVVTGTPTEDGSSAGIYIACSSPGDLWVDDVQLREGEPDAADVRVTSAQPERKGNVLYNSSFELGADGWGPVVRLKAEAGKGVHGQAVARCTPGWDSILLESRPVVIRPDQRYTISASLKAAGPAEVEMEVMESADEGGDRPGRRDSLSRTFSIDSQWQRVSLNGVLRAPFTNGYLVQIRLRSGAGPVWADALQWEEGTLTAYRPAAPVEVALRAPSRFLKPGQPAVTDCRVYQSSPVPATAGSISVRLEDGDGRKVAEQKVAVTTTRTAKTTATTPSTTKPAAPRNVRLTWKLPRPGIYRAVAVPSGTPMERTGQALLCLFPDGPRPAKAPRIGIHGWSNPSSPNSAVQAAGFLGAGGFRLHDFRSFVQWYEVEPTAGQFVWFDQDVTDLGKRGYRMIGTLCRTPLWAGRDGDQHVRHRNWTSSPPRDWEEWERYVTAVARRYRGQIRAWEVWNEPWSKHFWSGTPAEYAELMVRTRRVIKAADPDALIIGGSFSPQFPRFTQAVLQAGGLEAMDVVSYHEYIEPGGVAEPGGERAPRLYESAAALREAIRRRGGEQPLWCTETGVKCPSFYSWLPKQGQPYSSRVAVATLVKGLTFQLAAGVDRAYYYHMGGLEWGQGYPSRILNAAYTLLDYDGSPKPTLPALAQLVAMLGEATEPADLSTPTLRAYRFRRPAGAKGGPYVAVVWARGADPVRLEGKTVAGVKAQDAMGAPLALPAAIDDRPVYLLAASPEAIEAAVQ